VGLLLYVAGIILIFPNIPDSTHYIINIINSIKSVNKEGYNMTTSGLFAIFRFLIFMKRRAIKTTNRRLKTVAIKLKNSAVKRKEPWGDEVDSIIFVFH